MTGLLGDPNVWADPRSSGNGLLAMAQAIAPNNRFVGGLLNYGNSMSAAQDADMKRKAFRMKMEADQMQLDRGRREMATEQQIEEAARSSLISPERANALSMGPMPDGSNVPMVQPGFDQSAFLQKMYGINPLKAVEMERSLAKDNSPLTVAPGASLVDRRTFKPVYTAPKEQSLPAAVQEYQFAVGQGYKGNFEQWDMARKKAGANSVSLSVNTEKSLLNEMAGGLGKAMTEARGSAQAALGTINTVNRLNDALNSGQVMAGPGTSFRQFGLQVGNTLGVAGKDAQEKLLNTRQAIQSLAQLELDAAQQMKGQGQITEAERSIIRRAASGDIDGMTVPELRLLGGVLDRSARYKIQNYRSQVAPLKSNPNAAPLAPFLDIEEPPSTSRPAGAVRRFNPATGKIE